MHEASLIRHYKEFRSPCSTKVVAMYAYGVLIVKEFTTFSIRSVKYLN
jgi:hypothetical protein